MQLQGTTFYGSTFFEEALTGLRRLQLMANWITDITPLAALTDLPDLWLVRNRIVDLSTLAKWSRVRGLHLNE